MKTIILSPSTGTIPVITSEQTVLLKSGVYTSPLRFAGRSIVIQPESANAPPPLFKIKTDPIQMVGPSSRVRIRGFDCLSTGTTPGGTRGLVLLGKNSADIQFDRMGWTGYGYNAVIQHPKMESAPRGEWFKSIAFRRCRFLDAVLTYVYSAQGMFIGQFDGLAIDDCVFDRSGWDGKTDNAKQFSHNIYANAASANLTVRNSAFLRPAMYAIQARGEGSVIEGNLIYDAATGILVNGNKGTVKNNLIVAGHYIAAFKDGSGKINPGFGAGGCEWCAASGTCDGNIYVHTGPPPRPKMTVAPPWWLSNRSEAWSTEKPGWTLGKNAACKMGPKLSAAQIDAARKGTVDAAALMKVLRQQAGL